MDNFKWRSPSRIVAIVDLVTSIFGLAMGIFLVLIIVTEPNAVIQELEKNPDTKPSESDIKAFMWIMGISVAIACVIVAIGLWAAVRLLKATKKGADLVDAVKKARFWRRVNIAFVILYLFNLFGGTAHSILTTIAGLIFEGILISIVSKFIEELEEAVKTPAVTVRNLNMV